MILTNTVKKIIIAIITIILLWFIYILAKDWLKPRIVKALGGYTQKEMKTTIDTLDIKYKDIYIKYKEIETKALLNNKPEYVYIDRIVKKPATNKSSHKGKSQPPTTQKTFVKRYVTAINDTILNGNIETMLSVDSCKIVSQTFKYKPKIPYIREKIVTIVETKETILSDKPKAYIGLGLDINSNNQITPQVLYLSKKKWLYKAGYTKEINNQYPAAITIGIAKLF